MSVDVTVETLVRRPREEVAAYMFDPAHEADWTTGVVRSRPLQDGALRPGARVERVTRFLGREFGYVYEVVARDGDRSVDLTVEKPFPMRIRYELEDSPAGTMARIRARGEPTSFFRIAGPLMTPMVRKNIAADLAMLKERLEAGSP